jgi:hypothetical protein
MDTEVDFLFGRIWQFKILLESSDTERIIEPKLLMCWWGGGEGERREVTLALDFFWLTSVLSDNAFVNLRDRRFEQKNICVQTFGIRFYVMHTNFSFDIQV